MTLLEALADCRARLVAHLREIADDLEAQEVPADLEPEDCWPPQEFGAAFHWLAAGGGS